MRNYKKTVKRVLKKHLNKKTEKTSLEQPVVNPYKKESISFPIETDHPKPYSRSCRFDKDGDYWVRRNGDHSGQATILCGGDLMCEPAMSEAAYLDGEYDFRPAFRCIRPILSSADLTIANLETIVSERFPYAREIHRVPHHTGVRYHCNAPVEYLDALRYGSFDALVLANNHNADGGYEGIIDTLDNLDSNQFMHTGLFRNSNEERVLLIDVNDIKLAVLSYTEHINRHLDEEFLTEAGCEQLTNMYSKEKLQKDIDLARAKGAEFVLVYIHFLGREYSHVVIDRQVQTAQEIADAGADCIMGSHMHCVQKYDTVVSRDGRRVPVTYSLGNLMTSDNTGELTKRTFLYKLVLQKENDVVAIKQERFIPLRVVQGIAKSNYIIMPTQESYRNYYYSAFLDKEQSLIESEIGDGIQMDVDESDATNRDYRAEIVNGETTILRARTRKQYRVIPETTDGKTPVRRIGKESFQGAIMTELTLPDTLTHIGYAAFYNCKNLEKVNMGKGVKVLERSAFNNCSKLEEVLLPEGLIEIGERAFRNTALHDIYIPSSVVIIADDAFDGCEGLIIHCDKGSFAEQYAENNNISSIIKT